MWDILAIFAMFLLLAVALETIRSNIGRVLEANPRARAAREDYDAAMDESRAQVADLRVLQGQRDAVRDAITLLNNRIRTVTESVQHIQPSKPVVIREIGKPLKTTALFEANVSNRYLKFANRPPMVERLNPVWGRSVLIQIWAISRLDAKRTLERQFPSDLGYEIDWGRAFAESMVMDG